MADLPDGPQRPQPGTSALGGDGKNQLTAENAENAESFLCFPLCSLRSPWFKLFR